MSDLNLIPNPQVMCVQALVFLSQVYVINRFLVIPFGKLKSLRSQVTEGADSKSEDLKREIKRVSDEIHAHLVKAQEDVKNIKETGRAEAKKLRELDVQRAHKQMSDLVNQTRKEVQENLVQERKKIHTITQKFADEIYAKISN